MTKTQELALSFPHRKAYKWAVLAILIGVAPLLLHEQWITGPLVNAILVAATLQLGAKQALTLALIPSSVALATGTLPIVLASTIPFIIMGNILLISGVQLLKTKPLLGVLIGATIKFIWLAISSTWILQFFIGENFLPKVATMLSWPQLATAIIGGIFALGILTFWKK